MDRISVLQSLSEEEFISFSLNRFLKGVIDIILYSFILISGVVMLILWSEAFYPLIILFLLLLILGFRYLQRIYRKKYTSDVILRYQFSNDLITVESDKFAYTQSWDLVYRAEESKKGILLFSNRFNTIYLMKRSFEHPEDLEMIKSIIKGKDHIEQKALR